MYTSDGQKYLDMASGTSHAHAHAHMASGASHAHAQRHMHMHMHGCSLVGVACAQRHMHACTVVGVVHSACMHACVRIQMHAASHLIMRYHEGNVVA